MPRKGNAGTALPVAVLGSFVVGTVAMLLLAILAPSLIVIALKFGASEYFSLLVPGLVSAITFARGSILKARAMVVLGLLLGLVGTDRVRRKTYPSFLLVILLTFLGEWRLMARTQVRASKRWLISRTLSATTITDLMIQLTQWLTTLGRAHDLVGAQ